MRKSDHKINVLENMMLDYEAVYCPLTHDFGDGLYMRGIVMKAGTWITSLVHNTHHPFFLLEGQVDVYSENDGVQHLKAPFNGMTRPGTRRVLYIIEDAVWVTVHATDIKPASQSEKDIDRAVCQIEAQIIEPYVNPLLGGRYINNKYIPAEINHP